MCKFSVRDAVAVISLLVAIATFVVQYQIMI